MSSTGPAAKTRQQLSRSKGKSAQDLSVVSTTDILEAEKESAMSLWWEERDKCVQTEELLKESEEAMEAMQKIIDTLMAEKKDLKTRCKELSESQEQLQSRYLVMKVDRDDLSLKSEYWKSESEYWKTESDKWKPEHLKTPPLADLGDGAGSRSNNTYTRPSTRPRSPRRRNTERPGGRG